MPIGPWTFLVFNCYFGLCIWQEDAQIGTFRDEHSCMVTAIFNDELREAENKTMGYPYYYSESTCFNWVEHLKNDNK
jgi:hypothetical protein